MTIVLLPSVGVSPTPNGWRPTSPSRLPLTLPFATPAWWRCSMHPMSAAPAIVSRRGCPVCRRLRSVRGGSSWFSSATDRLWTLAWFRLTPTPAPAWLWRRFPPGPTRWPSTWTVWTTSRVTPTESTGRTPRRECAASWELTMSFSSWLWTVSHFTTFFWISDVLIRNWGFFLFLLPFLQNFNFDLKF